jgi:hypothetical protein
MRRSSSAVKEMPSAPGPQPSPTVSEALDPNAWPDDPREAPLADGPYRPSGSTGITPIDCNLTVGRTEPQLAETDRSKEYITLYAGESEAYGCVNGNFLHVRQESEKGVRYVACDGNGQPIVVYGRDPYGNRVALGHYSVVTPAGKGFIWRIYLPDQRRGLRVQRTFHYELSF